MTYTVVKSDTVFLDTNVLVYAYDLHAGEKYHRAKELIRKCWQEQTGCVSVQVLQEFYVTATRKIANPLTPNEAGQVIQDISTWRILSPGIPDILQAIDFQQKNRLSYWDAAIIEIALRGGCKFLYSEDLNHGQLFGNMKILNPFI